MIRTTLAACLGLAAALLLDHASTPWRAVAATEGPRPVAVPDDGGALAEVLLHWTAAQAEATAPTYRDFLGALLLLGEAPGAGDQHAPPAHGGGQPLGEAESFHIERLSH